LSNPHHINKSNIQKYILSLALCHTVIVEDKNGEKNYIASSPDELALVNAAKFFGVSFIGRDDESNIKIRFNDD
jgi:phospholipid-transporting ATPase